MVIGFSLAAFFVIASLILVLRYWLLPDIQDYKGKIESTVSRAIGERVAIGGIQADWRGIHPHLTLSDVRIIDKSGQAALTLDRIENSLSWMSFLTGEVRFSSLEIDHPTLGIRRDKSGTVYVAGIPVNQGPADSGLSDWLLHQSRILIRNGFILWEDEERDAPPLMLQQVNFALVNIRQHHLFGLQAVPPADLSSPLDIRGNLFGNSLNDLKDWRGKLYARIDHADTSKLKIWLPSPEPLVEGKGGMRVWLDFSHEKPEAVTADLALSGVRAKLASDLPEIDMKKLHGRIGWKNLDGGFDAWTEMLSVETVSGESIPPTDFLLKSVPAQQSHVQEGELSANSLDLETISRLSEYFPMTPGIRKGLAEYSPKGKLEDLEVSWKGDEPESRLL
ncbi:MAG TPA: AsmA family protein, partial [Burkholderiales bacterium]|nr:AsmA family protein [Burkholderiales bacterium]